MSNRILITIILILYINNFITNDLISSTLKDKTTNTNFQVTNRYTINKVELLPLYGRVVDSEYNSSRDLVILIEDYHCNPEVQQNIFYIINNIFLSLNIKRIYSEGAPYGKVDTSLFLTTFDKKLKEKILNNLLSRGLISGAEYFEIIKNKNILYGLENWDLYCENVNNLKKILDKGKEISKLIKILNSNLLIIQNKYYSKKLKKINKQLEKLTKIKVKQNIYYSQLLKFCKKIKLNILYYPNIQKFIKLSLISKKISINKLNQEIKKLLRYIQLTYPFYFDQLNISSKTPDLPDIYFELYKQSKKSIPKFHLKYPNFTLFIDYLKLNKSFNLLNFFTEENLFYKSIFSRNMENKFDNEIFLFSELIKLYIKFLELKITHEEYKYLKENIDNFNFLANKFFHFSPFSLKISQELLNFYESNIKRSINFEYVLEEYFKNLENNKLSNYTNQFNISKNDSLSSTDTTVTNLNNLKENLVKYFHLITTEDNAIINHIDKFSNIIIVIVGGFHRDIVKQLSIKNNISFLIITPNVTKPQCDKIYKNLFTLNTTPNDILFSSLAPPLINSLLQTNPNISITQLNSYLKHFFENILLPSIIDIYFNENAKTVKNKKDILKNLEKYLNKWLENIKSNFKIKINTKKKHFIIKINSEEFLFKVRKNKVVFVSKFKKSNKNFKIFIPKNSFNAWPSFHQTIIQNDISNIIQPKKNSFNYLENGNNMTLGQYKLFLRNISKKITYKPLSFHNNKENVIYHFGGFDIFTPFTLFKKAENVFSFGENSFGNANDFKNFLQNRYTDLETSFLKYDTFDATDLYRNLEFYYSGLGFLAILRIIMLLNGEIKRISYFKLTDQGEIKFLNETELKDNCENAVIEFLLNGKTKRFWYIKYDLRDGLGHDDLFSENINLYFNYENKLSKILIEEGYLDNNHIITEKITREGNHLIETLKVNNFNEQEINIIFKNLLTSFTNNKKITNFLNKLNYKYFLLKAPNEDIWEGFGNKQQKIGYKILLYEKVINPAIRQNAIVVTDEIGISYNNTPPPIFNNKWERNPKKIKLKKTERFGYSNFNLDTENSNIYFGYTDRDLVNKDEFFDKFEDFPHNIEDNSTKEDFLLVKNKIEQNYSVLNNVFILTLNTLFLFVAKLFLNAQSNYISLFNFIYIINYIFIFSYLLLFILDISMIILSKFNNKLESELTLDEKKKYFNRKKWIIYSLKEKFASNIIFTTNLPWYIFAKTDIETKNVKISQLMINQTKNRVFEFLRKLILPIILDHEKMRLMGYSNIFIVITKPILIIKMIYERLFKRKKFLFIDKYSRVRDIYRNILQESEKKEIIETIKNISEKSGKDTIIIERNKYIISLIEKKYRQLTSSLDPESEEYRKITNLKNIFVRCISRDNTFHPLVERDYESLIGATELLPYVIEQLPQDNALEIYILRDAMYYLMAKWYLQDIGIFLGSKRRKTGLIYLSRLLMGLPKEYLTIQEHETDLPLKDLKENLYLTMQSLIIKSFSESRIALSYDVDIKKFNQLLQDKFEYEIEKNPLLKNLAKLVYNELKEGGLLNTEHIRFIDLKISGATLFFMQCTVNYFAKKEGKKIKVDIFAIGVGSSPRNIDRFDPNKINNLKQVLTNLFKAEGVRINFEYLSHDDLVKYVNQSVNQSKIVINFNFVNDRWGHPVYYDPKISDFVLEEPDEQLSAYVRAIFTLIGAINYSKQMSF